MNRGSRKLSRSVVWTPIPILSWFCPAIGHVGVCDSYGTVYDFQGSHYVGRGNMLFGRPVQSWKLEISDDEMNNAIESSYHKYSQINYNFFCSNCHCFAASVLDDAQITPVLPCLGSWSSFATLQIIIALILYGRSLSVSKFFAIWLPFVVIWGIIIGIIILLKYYG